MPPRPSTAVLMAVPKGTPILPFLYPAASRRFLHVSSSLNQNEGSPFEENAKTMLQAITQQSRPTLPPLPEDGTATTISSSRRLTHTDWAGSVQREKKAFKDLGALNEGVTKIINHVTQDRDRKRAIQESMGEKIDRDIYKFMPPIAENTYLSPKDLRFEEMDKFFKLRRSRVKEDFFERTQENPLNHYKNFNLLKDFMTSAGRIKHRSLTGLSNVNQRKLSKAIRRAIGIGLMPSVYRHPEILQQEQKQLLEPGGR
ncbi:hypothetical protein ABW19_dt0208025 [Dactylella cylindrospora]|nr:hypothetical protein ABW19_dt0208025 [Dactylella cylindrospora]